MWCWQVQVGLLEASEMLTAAQQLLQDTQSSSNAQQLQLTQQLATACQVSSTQWMLMAVQQNQGIISSHNAWLERHDIPCMNE